MPKLLIKIFGLLVETMKALNKNKQDLIMENLALRQQLANYQQKIVKPEIDDQDRAFWVALSEKWDNWADTLIIVKPETVIHWRKQRFKKFWKKKCQEGKKPGRPKIDAYIRKLIRQNNFRAAAKTKLSRKSTRRGRKKPFSPELCSFWTFVLFPAQPPGHRLHSLAYHYRLPLHLLHILVRCQYHCGLYHPHSLDYWPLCRC